MISCEGCGESGIKIDAQNTEKGAIFERTYRQTIYTQAKPMGLLP